MQLSRRFFSYREKLKAVFKIYSEIKSRRSKYTFSGKNITHVGFYFQLATWPSVFSMKCNGTHFYLGNDQTMSSRPFSSKAIFTTSTDHHFYTSLIKFHFHLHQSYCTIPRLRFRVDSVDLFVRLLHLENACFL